MTDTITVPVEPTETQIDRAMNALIQPGGNYLLNRQTMARAIRAANYAAPRQTINLTATDSPLIDDELARQRCAWNEDEEGYWNTTCGEIWIFNDGGPSDNRCNYCFYCGKPIEEKLFDYASLERMNEQNDE